MRNLEFSTDEYYHIYNRGIGKKDIFLDDRDYIRFLFLILFHQSPVTFSNLGREVDYYIRDLVFKVAGGDIEEILSKRWVELIAFTLMPNHIHLKLKQVEEGGISRYMQRILTAYAKYFNSKYYQSGHLFQNVFQAVHIEDNTQLLHASAYIHKNQRELKGWRNRECDYPWSSCYDYTKENRWSGLLIQDIILDQFNDRRDYLRFIKTSPAKEWEESLEG